jgi:Protein of unknown function (DUF3617)
VTAVRGIALLCVVVTCSVAIVRADELPHRRPGLWEITHNNVDANNPARTSKICIDAATETMLRDMGATVAKSNCSKAAVSVSGNAVSVDSVCQLDRTRLTTHTVITFTSDTTYHHVAAVHFDPPLFGRSDSTSEMDGRWLGPCAADMRPGDVITPMGKINLVDRARAPK